MLKLISIAALFGLLLMDGAASSPSTPGTEGRSLGIPEIGQKHLGAADHPDQEAHRANSLPRKPWLKPPKVSKNYMRNPPASGMHTMRHEPEYKHYPPRNLNRQPVPYGEPFPHNFIPPNVRPNPHYKNLNEQNPYQKILPRNKVKSAKKDHSKNVFQRVPITQHNRPRPIRWKRYPGSNPYHRKRNNRRRYQRIQPGEIPRKEFWSAPSKQHTPYSKGVKRFPYNRYDASQEDGEWKGTPLQEPKLLVQPIRPVRNPYTVNNHGDAPENIKPIQYGPNLVEEEPIKYIPKTGNVKKGSQVLPKGSLGNAKNVIVNGTVYTIHNPVQGDQDRGGNKAGRKEPAQKAKVSLENEDDSSSSLEEHPDRFATAPDTRTTRVPVQKNSKPYEVPKHLRELQDTSQRVPHESVPSTTQMTPFWSKGISVIKGLFAKARDLAKGTLGVRLTNKEHKVAITETTTPYPPLWRRSVSAIKGILSKATDIAKRRGASAIKGILSKATGIAKRRGVSAVKGILSKATDIAKGAVGLPRIYEDDVHPDEPTTPITQVLQVNVPITDDLMSQSELVRISSPGDELLVQYAPTSGNANNTPSEMVHMSSPGEDAVIHYPPIPENGNDTPSGEHDQADHKPQIQRRRQLFHPTVPRLHSTPEPTVKTGILSKVESVFKRLLSF